MQFLNDDTRSNLKLRHELGSFTGYFGIFLGLMALLATSSEGTPFAMNQAPWVVFGCMVAAYAFGWAIAPIMSRIAGVR